MNFRLIFCVLLSVPILALSEDSLIIPLAPDSIKFNSIDTLRSSDIANVLSGMLAYTVEQDVKFQSMAPVDPFTRPNAIFVFNIVGVTKNIELNLKGPRFPLESYGDLDEHFYTLEDRTNQRYNSISSGKPVLLKIDAGEELSSEKSEHAELLKTLPAKISKRLDFSLVDPELGQAVKEGTFNVSREEDYQFLVELETVKLLIDALQKFKGTLRDKIPDIFWVNVNSLDLIVKRHGSDSFQAKEAVRLIEQTITETVTAVNNIYDKNAVVAVFTQTPLPSLSRKSRSILAEKDEDLLGATQTNHNLAYEFGPNFSVAFALIAFTSVILILAVFGISVAMWFIDPGRDSIIYRMTSQRMKKD